MKLLASIVAVHVSAWSTTLDLLAGALARTAMDRNQKARILSIVHNHSQADGDKVAQALLRRIRAERQDA